MQSGVTNLADEEESLALISIDCRGRVMSSRSKQDGRLPQAFAINKVLVNLHD